MNLLTLFLAFLFASVAAVAKEKNFDCQQNRCGLISDKAYPHLVVGIIGAVAESDDSKKIFNWARQHKQWKYLPAGDNKFYDSVGIVSIVADGSSAKGTVSLMLPRPEANAIQFQPGDLVRYTPHRAGHEAPPENTEEAIAYWSVTGCVAVLCRSADKACQIKYKQGVFRLPDGVQITLAGKTYPNGVAIDTQSMLPLPRQK